MQAVEHDTAQAGRRLLCGTCSGQSGGSPQPGSDARGPGTRLTQTKQYMVNCLDAEILLPCLTTVTAMAAPSIVAQFMNLKAMWQCEETLLASYTGARGPCHDACQ